MGEAKLAETAHTILSAQRPPAENQYHLLSSWAIITELEKQ